ncbi:MAG TPA: peptidoglycan editing factor PgeF [Candidatus Polarisedimenticolia bacterium]|nr:peptidoglycan editing factor PgeF [Candidatus Polarisedimenticolia bacterium]
MHSASPLRLHPSGLYLHCPAFPSAGGWNCGFTTRRAAGSLDAVLPILGWSALPTYRLAQVHGHRIVAVDPALDDAGSRREGDGLATRARGIVMAVAAADCVPIVLFDPVREAGAVLHAGWRGTVAGIVREAVGTFRDRWGSGGRDLMALVGPSIGGCCYEVGNDVLQAFRSAGIPEEVVVARREGSSRLDLPAANRWLLLQSGLLPERVLLGGLCTFCRDDLFPSFRREGPGAGRLLGFVGSSLP